MNNLTTVEYKRTGKSSNTDEFGMREMQARAYKSRNAQYLLLKAPPASGKSRALMFLALDKLHNQGLAKVIVAVPEMSIGASFRDEKLSDHGFFTDWKVLPEYNLCVAGGDDGKVNTFVRFMDDPNADILVCTHATLRYAYQRLEPEAFNNTLLAIDEFHHVSADGQNRLGELIDGIIKGSNAHIIAMTGSYFRGDAVPILLAEDEDLFEQVTYTYYEQLNGYKYLKSLGIGYHFYQGQYLSALTEVIDTTKKTIIHIPNVNSVESTKDKRIERDRILDAIGEVVDGHSEKGIIVLKDKLGRLIRVADLVEDDKSRIDVQNYLNQVDKAEDVDIIIALGMAKEGFDWPWCEHVLTIGFRSSLTEIVQIIGRSTRDSVGKTHAQFTNLISEPHAEDDDVKVSVNNMLKAITISLLMEQVLKPSINFKPRSRLREGEVVGSDTIIVDDRTNPMSAKVEKLINNTDDLKAKILQSPKVMRDAINGDPDLEVIKDSGVLAIVRTAHPDLNEDEVQTVCDAVWRSMALQSTGGVYDGADMTDEQKAKIVVVSRTDGEQQSMDLPTQKLSTNSSSYESETSIEDAVNKKFVMINDKFYDVEKLDINLIDSINPFQGAYEILSKSVTPSVLKNIQEAVLGMRSNIQRDEVVILWPRILSFRAEYKREPSITSVDDYERRLAEAVAFLRREKRAKLKDNADS